MPSCLFMLLQPHHLPISPSLVSMSVHAIIPNGDTKRPSMSHQTTTALSSGLATGCLPLKALGDPKGRLRGNWGFQHWTCPGSPAAACGSWELSADLSDFEVHFADSSRICVSNFGGGGIPTVMFLRECWNHGLFFSSKSPDFVTIINLAFRRAKIPVFISYRWLKECFLLPPHPHPHRELSGTKEKPTLNEHQWKIRNSWMNGKKKGW